MTQDETCQDLFHLLTISYRFSEDIAQSVIASYLEQAENIQSPRGWCLKRARWLLVDGYRREAYCAELTPGMLRTRATKLENPLKRAEARQRLARFAQLMGSTAWAQKADYHVYQAQSQ